MAGRHAQAVITRYAGIQVQTSSLGLQVPQGWGTFKCKSNLVWYGGFNAIAQKTSGGGKGGSSQITGYNYTADIILGICQGPINGASTVYVDSSVFTDGPTTALQQANLHLNLGTIGQAVWSYLTTNYPTQALGYSGMAIAYQSAYPLDQSAATPNISFEVIKITGFSVGSNQDIDPTLMITDFLTNARTGVPRWPSGVIGSMTQFQNYALAAGLLLSPVLDYARSAQDALTEYLLATNTTCVWSEGLLKFIPYGDASLSGNGKTYTPSITPDYNLTTANFLVQNKADPPVKVDVKDQSDAYNVVQIEYLDRSNQYNIGIALSSDAANVAQYGERREDPQTVHCIADGGVAAITSQLHLQRTLYIRAEQRFSLAYPFMLLEPGDILTLTEPGLGYSAYGVRITEIDESEDGSYDLVSEDFPTGTGSSPLYTMQNAIGYQVNQDTDPGSVEANLLLWGGSPGSHAPATWAVLNVAITANAVNDQYGLMTATSFSTVGTGLHYTRQPITVFPGLNYTFSVCVQKSAHKNYRIAITDSGQTNGAYIEVDTNAGVVLTQPTKLGTGIVIDGALSPSLVSGIYIVTITVQVPSVTTLYPSIFFLSDAGALSWTGDSSNFGNVSQAQFQQGIAVGVYAQTFGSIAGPVLFNAPSAIQDGGLGVWAAVAGGPNWGGANVWISVDGTNYENTGVIDTPARFGITTTTIPAGGNLLTWSTDLTNTTFWGQGNFTVTGGQSDPGSGSTAVLLTRVATGVAFFYQPVAVAAAGTTYDFSIYMKAGTLAGQVTMRLQDSVTGIIFAQTNISVTGSWARYDIFTNVPTNANGVAVLITPVLGGSAGETLFVAWPQLEQGAFDNPYVPTGKSPNFGDPDTTNALGVDIGASSGTLDSATQDVADASGTLCLLDQELISFEVATLTNPSRYSLTTYIRRGVMGTNILSHDVEAPFVRLDDSVFQFPYFPTAEGQPIFVKFQSFNHWGRGVIDLADCLPYSITPQANGASAAQISIWTAVATAFNNSGNSTPAIVVTGSVDNPSATGIEFLYKVTGTAAWSSAGISSAPVNRKEITSVTGNTTYDVGVRYVVNGVAGNIQTCTGSPVTTPALIVSGAMGGAGIVANQIILADSSPGPHTFALPAGTYGHVDISLTAPGGTGSVQGFGGGGGENRLLASIAVTPGTDVLGYFIGSYQQTSTVTASGPFTGMTANYGADATSVAGGAGGTGGVGGAGTNGNAGSNVRGGSAGLGGGDQINYGDPGTTPGGGGFAGYVVGNDPDTGYATIFAAQGAYGQIIVTTRT